MRPISPKGGPGRAAQAAAGPRTAALLRVHGQGAAGSVDSLVERFDRRGTEPFELFTLEFGHNSFKIQEFSLENSKISENLKISTFPKISAKFRQNFIKI